MKNRAPWPLFSPLNTPAMLELRTVDFSLTPNLHYNKFGSASETPTPTPPPLHSSVLYLQFVVPESFPEVIYLSFFAAVLFHITLNPAEGKVV